MRKATTKPGLVRRLREANGVKQAVMASDLGMDVKTIARAEKGRLPMAFETVKRIAEYLGRLPEDLISLAEVAEEGPGEPAGSPAPANRPAEARLDPALPDGDRLTLRPASADRLIVMAERAVEIQTVLRLTPEEAAQPGAPETAKELASLLNDIRSRSSRPRADLEDQFAVLLARSRVAAAVAALAGLGIGVSAESYLYWERFTQFYNRLEISYSSHEVMVVGLGRVGEDMLAVSIDEGTPPTDAELEAEDHWVSVNGRMVEHG